jgi:hypothetical protein
MIRRILTIFLVAAITVSALFSCKKVKQSTTDPTRNYFPLTFGKYVTYAVDSIYYDGAGGTRAETRCQLKYAITDTFTDSRRRLSYIMDIFFRPYDGAVFTPSGVIIITPQADSLFYFQDGAQYNKLIFPVVEGFSWAGNTHAQVQDTIFSYLKNWKYVYQKYHLSYFNGYVNFDNTVSVLENDENVNYQNVDSLPSGYKTYAKEVYAYNVGMIYKEWTHYTWGSPDTTHNRNGYTVIMRAIDHN